MDNKIKQHLKSLGCDDFVKISLAHQLYIELSEVRTMYDVEFLYNKDLDIIYLTAKPTKNAEINIFIPYSTSTSLSMKTVENLQKQLCTSDSVEKCVTLACIEGDSTIVLYSFTSGIKSVDNPDCLVRHKSREEQRDFVEKEIKRNRCEILSRAYDNGVVELDEVKSSNKP